MFANAALDFVSCLIHHVRGSEERQQLEELICTKEAERLLSNFEMCNFMYNMNNLFQSFASWKGRFTSFGPSISGSMS